MNKRDREELKRIEEWSKRNEKLLIWAGFTKFTQDKWSMELYCGCQYWKQPDGTIIKNDQELPDLVNDANDQIKFLFPKLKELKLRVEQIADYDTIPQYYYCYLIENQHYSKGCGESTTPTLAFALAVEKLIDNLEK